jgi:hypothetical protein
MGLWAQNVGVKGSSLPQAVLARSGGEQFGVPEGMDGWSWATLEGFLDIDELDQLVAEAGQHAGGPALAFSVHDSDSVYLVGTDETGVRFRLMVNPEAWEDEPIPQEVDEAAAWSKEHAPLDPSPKDIAEILGRQFVFGEEGLDVVLASMGLVPAEAAAGVQEMHGADATVGELEVWNWLQPVDSPKERFLERGRWYATLEHGEVRGYLLAAEEDSRAMVIALGLDEALMSEVPDSAVTGFAIRPESPIQFVGQMPSREGLANVLSKQDVTLGPWEEVPEDVSRDLVSTAAWLLRG